MNELRNSAILCLTVGLLCCDEPLQLPPLLHDPGELVGSSWLLCDSPVKHRPEDAVHHKGIVERLNRLFPRGTPSKALQDELLKEGFTVRSCVDDPTIRIATYRWKEHWGGQGLIAFKGDGNDKLVWATGFNSYGGP